MSKKTSTPAPDHAPPSKRQVAALLGGAHAAYRALAERGDGAVAEWRQYTKKSPWVVRVSKGARAYYYLQPEAGGCRVTVLLGARAAEAALAGAVPASLHDAIRQAKVYPEGRPVVVRVTTDDDVRAVEQLLEVKLKPPKAG
jgi:kynureninase